jgi:purine-binding chemotaxis protein CheW
MPLATEETRVELACLEVRGQLYGIDVQQVREIVRAQELTPLPRAPALVEGVIDLRGVIIPVVDLGRALGGAPVEHDAGARFAIVEIDGLAFGLRAEAASEVLAVNGSDVQSPPALVAQSGYDAIRAVVRRSGKTPVLVLALEAVLESVYRSGLSDGAPETATSGF